MAKLSWVRPRHVEVPDHERTVIQPMWDVVVRKMRQIEKAKSPRSKMNCLSQAFALLYHQYELAYPEKYTKAGADYTVPAMICLLMQTKLTDPFATYRLL